MIYQPPDTTSQSLISTAETCPPQLAHEYGEALAKGRKWQEWLDNPTDSSCPVLPIRLSIRMLTLHYGWYIFDGNCPPGTQIPSRYFPPNSLKAVLRWHGISTKRRYTRVTLRQRRRSKSGGKTKNDYVLQTGPGVIFALESQRTDGPHWSDIALAAYRTYEAEDLRFVFRVNVINPLTTAIVRDAYLRNSRRWPDRHRSYWWHGSPAYQAIMSTPNARGVAALVLGGYERGTRWIPVIITWADTTHARAYLQMLFVICTRV
ncbi:hypothetical protein N7507_004685 [Penicillium longicatenatum]|nr:hypothetical protein N7507_004685 [Penicillium longicatenatum]